MPSKTMINTPANPTAAHGTLFHILPSRTLGAHLLPLKELRRTYPELYTEHAAKYRGREHVMDEPVPPLDCTWGDVVFFAPLHPAPLFEALRRSGHKMGNLEPATIDASALDPKRCIIRLMRHGAEGHYPDPADADDYLPLTTATLRAVSRVTVAAITRLENLAPDDPWLAWVDVPHILHRGPVPLELLRTP